MAAMGRRLFRQAASTAIVSIASLSPADRVEARDLEFRADYGDQSNERFNFWPASGQ